METTKNHHKQPQKIYLNRLGPSGREFESPISVYAYFTTCFNYSFDSTQETIIQNFVEQLVFFLRGGLENGTYSTSEQAHSAVPPFQIKLDILPRRNSLLTPSRRGIITRPQRPPPVCCALIDLSLFQNSEQRARGSAMCFHGFRLMNTGDTAGGGSGTFPPLDGTVRVDSRPVSQGRTTARPPQNGRIPRKKGRPRTGPSLSIRR